MNCTHCGARLGSPEAKEPCERRLQESVSERDESMAEVNEEAKFEIRMSLTANQIRQLKSCMSHSYGDQEYFAIQEVKVIFDQAVGEAAARKEGL
jgi:hypothetical protein